MGNILELKEVYNVEHNKYSHYIPVGYDHSKIERLIEKISKVNYDNFVVELAPSNFKIKLVKHNWLFIISQPYESELLDGEVIVSIFRADSREHLFSGVLSLNDINGWNHL